MNIVPVRGFFINVFVFLAKALCEAAFFRWQWWTSFEWSATSKAVESGWLCLSGCPPWLWLEPLVLHLFSKSSQCAAHSIYYHFLPRALPLPLCLLLRDHYFIQLCSLIDYFNFQLDRKYLVYSQRNTFHGGLWCNMARFKTG